MKHFNEEGKARFLAAEEFLKKQPTVDPDNIAAIGYCFGGGVVLNMARQGADLKGGRQFPRQPGSGAAGRARRHQGEDQGVQRR